jgi:hypothetical protein
MLPLNNTNSVYGHFGIWLWTQEIMAMKLNKNTAGDSTVTTARDTHPFFFTPKGGVQ